MEIDLREKSEQGSEEKASVKVQTNDLNDQTAFRQMTSAKAAGTEGTLPGLMIDMGGGSAAAGAEKAAVQAKPAAAGKDAYKEQEKIRAEAFADLHEHGTPLERTLLTLAALPKDLTISSKPGQLKIESDSFQRIAEAIPGAALDPTFRKILTSFKAATIDGGKVQIDGDVKMPVTVDGPGGAKIDINLTLKNPSFDIVPDDKNPNCIRLKNIKGISVDKLGVGGDIKEVSLSLERDGNGKPSLKVEIPRPVSPPPDPKDKFAFLKQVGAAFMPEVSTSVIPLDTADSAEVLERAFKELGQFVKSPDKTTPADLAAGVAGVDLKTVLAGAMDGIQSVSKKGDALEIKREKATSHDFGGLPIDIAQTVKAKFEANGKALSISQIEGVSMKLPVPDEVAKAVGLPVPFKANLKEVSISEPDKDGNRVLSVKTDSILDTVKIKVDKDMRPVAADNKGNISVDLTVKQKDVAVNLSVDFNPAQMEKPPANGPDFKISIKGGDGNYVKLIESMTGTKIDSPVKDMVSNVTSISKQGDLVQITRDKNTSHDLGGVVLDAGRNIRFKVTPDGPAGARLSNIEGVTLKLPVQMPQALKDFGIDPGKEIITSVKTLGLSSPDDHGRRRVLLETNHLLRQVGVLLGPDMKPALDPKGNWYMYGLVDNPIANQKLPMALRFDKNNNLAMSTQELMRIGSNAAWQGTDNGGIEGVGFGIIGVATEAGAIALDVKDAVVDAAVAVKDVAVDAAVAVKDVAVDAAVTVGTAAVDGAVYVGNKAAKVGNWIASWFD